MIRPFFTAASAPPREDSVDLYDRIMEAVPRLRGQPSVESGVGQSGARTIIFPQEVFKTLPHREELLVLQRLDDPLVPKVTYADPAEKFFGMQRMPGVMLSTNMRDALTEEQQRVFARAIAGVIRNTARAITPEEAKSPSGPTESAGDIEKILAHPQLRAGLGRDLRCVSTLARLQPEHMAGSKKIMFFHNDLNPGNIFVDPQSLSPTAVIDWGGTRHGPQEEALSTLHRFMPSSLMDKIFEEYNAGNAEPVSRPGVLAASLVGSLWYARIALEANHHEDAGWNLGNALRAAREYGPPPAPRPKTLQKRT